MQRHIQTLFDELNSASEQQLLLHIAKMMALKDREYQDAYIANSLQDIIAVEMLAYDRKHKEYHNYEVIVQFLDEGVIESSTFASHVLCDWDVEKYMDEVVRPISLELAARVISKLPHPLNVTDVEVRVRSLDG